MRQTLSKILSLRISLILKFLLVLFLIWSLPARAGEVEEFITPTKDSSPADLAFDRHGNLWFTELHANKIGKLVPSRAKPDTSEGITDYDLPRPNSKPLFILIAKNGMIWFTEMGGNAIGQLDPHSEEIREFPIPTPDSEPHDLIEDVDGNIWFVEFEANKIGRLEPKTGMIREYPVNRGHPHGLALHDGKVWYTQGGKFWRKKFANKIGSLDPKTGQVKEIIIPPEKSVPHGMTQSASGAIWFTHFFTKKISRLEIANGMPSIVDYSLGINGGSPHDILVDDTRNLIWYVDNHGDRIGRLDLAKAKPGTSKGLTLFPIPTKHSHPNQLALDPEGNVWFTEMGMYFRGKYQRKIGKLMPHSQTVHGHSSNDRR